MVMGNYNVDLIDRRVGLGFIGTELPSQDKFPANFPYARWTYQLQLYQQYWNWFTGEIWREEIPDEKNEYGEPNLRWPLKINYFREVCIRHNDVLFGEVADTATSMVEIRVTPRAQARKKKKKPVDPAPPTQLIQPAEEPDEELEAAKDRAHELEQFFREVWSDNNGRALQQENGLISQFLGGCVFKVSWDPLKDGLEHHIRIESVLPDFFAPVWDSSDYWRLLEAWVVWRVPAREAQLKYGWKGDSATGDPLYIEHWTESELEITIGDQPLEIEVDGKTISYHKQKNVYGFVPFMYFPTERMGSFYGLSRMADLDGMAKELNSRFADLGDGVRESIDRRVFTRNVAGQIRTRDLGGVESAIDLGVTPPGTSEKPEVFSMDPIKITPELAKLPAVIRDEFGKQAFLPDVAEGEDEGSQRSALTLAFRMNPITTRGRAARTNWSTGLVRLSKMIAKIAILFGVGGITPAHLQGMDIYADWAPQIPRDREQQLNEAVLMMAANAMSPQTALKLLDLVTDPEEEIQRVLSFKKQVAAIDAMTALSSKPTKEGEQQPKTLVNEPIAATGFDQK